MIKVIKAEFMKNMKRKDILAMLLISILLPFLVTYLTNSGFVVKSPLKTPLENTFVIAFFMGTMLFPLLSIVCSANTLSREIENGSIRLILAKPVNRRQIFIAKFIILLCLCLVSLIFIFFSSYFSGILFFGLKKAPLLSRNGNVLIPIWKDILFTYILGFLGLLFCSSITLFISCYFQPSVSILVSLIILILSQALESKKQLRYFLPTYLYQISSTGLYSNEPIKEGLINMAILAGYIVLLLIFGIIRFERKDFV